MRILERNISSVKKIHSKYNTAYRIQGTVQEKELRHFSIIQDLLLNLKLVDTDDYIIVRKWIKADKEKNNIEKIREGSAIEVIGKIEYDSYSKENVMNAIELKQIH